MTKEYKIKVSKIISVKAESEEHAIQMIHEDDEETIIESIEEMENHGFYT